MIVVLNQDLAEVAPFRPTEASVADMYSRSVMEKLKLPWRSKVNFVREFEPGEGQLQYGFLGMLSDAYSRHVKVAVAPHDIWFVVMTGLAEVIAENVSACRPLFTNQEGKTQIAIAVGDPTDLTGNIDAFEAELRKLVPLDIDMFVPDFSTHTKASRNATMAAFMDGVKVYYDYAMFLCGIPAVKVLGTLEDWKLFKQRLMEIDVMFASVGVSISQWFGRVSAIADNIIETLEGEDRTEWWTNIFSQRNQGSGGQKSINGWVVDLYRDGRPGLIESFGFTCAAVPFKNLHEPEVDYTSFHGQFIRQRDDEGFVSCGYADFTVTVEKPGTEQAREPEFEISVVKVEAKSRVLDAKWTIGPTVTGDE